MKKLFVYLLLTVFCGFISAQSNTFTLKVVVENLNVINGNIMMELVKSNGDIYKDINILVDKLPAVIEIDQIPTGNYGIRYYYDENRNGKMDSYLIGIPKEGYGFSNNPYSKFGEPAFEKILFLVNENKSLTLETVNW